MFLFGSNDYYLFVNYAKQYELIETGLEKRKSQTARR
jgi:hypothetical protein